MGLSGFGPWIGGGGSEATAGAVGTSGLSIDGAAAFVAGGELDFLPLSLVLAAAGVLLAGVGASLFSLYARLLYQKFLNVFEDRAKNARPIKPREDKTNPVMIAAQNLAANSGFAPAPGVLCPGHGKLRGVRVVLRRGERRHAPVDHASHPHQTRHGRSGRPGYPHGHGRDTRRYGRRGNVGV